MARVQLPESRLKARKRKHRIVLSVVGAILALFVVGGLAALTHLPHYRIVDIQIAGAEGTEAQAVKKFVQEELSGNYLLLFPRNNVMMYPRSGIRSGLLEMYPRFASVELDAHDLRSLTVTITKRSPKAVWCGESLATKAPCLLLDEAGMAYESAPQSGGMAYTTYYGVLEAGALPRHYLNSQDFRSLTAFATALEAQQETRVATIAVDKAQDVELSFINGFKLLFALSDGSGDVYERFVLAMEAQPFKNRTTADFLYLDLRFGDRLYYKLKEEPAP